MLRSSICLVRKMHQPEPSFKLASVGFFSLCVQVPAILFQGMVTNRNVSKNGCGMPLGRSAVHPKSVSKWWERRGEGCEHLSSDCIHAFLKRFFKLVVLCSALPWAVNMLSPALARHATSEIRKMVSTWRPVSSELRASARGTSLPLQVLGSYAPKALSSGTLGSSLNGSSAGR